MNVIETKLPGVYIFEPQVYEDDRGFFVETHHQARYAGLGLPAVFVQDNHSRSKRNVLRGLHRQITCPQGKLVRAATGVIWDVAVDVDPESDTFKQWVGVELSDQNQRQLYIPPGFAHGFVVLSEYSDVVYKCTEFYKPGDEVGLLWSDRELAIEWPIRTPILSIKDQANPTLKQYREMLDL